MLESYRCTAKMLNEFYPIIKTGSRFGLTSNYPATAISSIVTLIDNRLARDASLLSSFFSSLDNSHNKVFIFFFFKNISDRYLDAVGVCH